MRGPAPLVRGVGGRAGFMMVVVDGEEVVELLIGPVVNHHLLWSYKGNRHHSLAWWC